MNLKYKEDRFWLILIISTLILLLNLRESPFSEPAFMLMGFYIFIYPAGWLIYFGLNFKEWDSNNPKKENSRKFNPTDRMLWLESELKKYTSEKYEEELAYLKEKYSSFAKDVKKTKEKRETEAIANAKTHKSSQNQLLYGTYATQIICPHCQTKGKVRKNTKERTEESREKGIIGATIGRKTITKKGQYTQLHCDICDVTWEV